MKHEDFHVKVFRNEYMDGSIKFRPVLETKSKWFLGLLTHTTTYWVYPTKDKQFELSECGYGQQFDTEAEALLVSQAAINNHINQWKKETIKKALLIRG